jgi:4-hydroxy-tetrahydrodipicolinate reductase
VTLKLVVNGAAGRLGRQVVAAAAGSADFVLAAAVVRANAPVAGRDAGELAGVGTLGVPLTTDLAAALAAGEVVVDVSVPEGSVVLVERAAALGRPVVVATTGHSERQLAAIAEAATRTAVLIAPNLSLGINLLVQLLPTIARALGPEYDVEIVEAHHRMKKDSPSGTALRLAEAVAEARGQGQAEVVRYGRQGLAPRQPGEIGLHSVRGGSIVGEHEVRFVSDGEELAVLHRTFSRDTYARGALRAAQFVAHQSPGRYTMQDLLASMV